MVIVEDQFLKQCMAHKTVNVKELQTQALAEVRNIQRLIERVVLETGYKQSITCTLFAIISIIAIIMSSIILSLTSSIN